MTMDKEDIYEVKEGSWAGHQAELSQSSGVLSLPSGNRLADISLTSDMTNSDIEDDTVLGHNRHTQLEDSNTLINNYSVSSATCDHKISSVNGQWVNDENVEVKLASNNPASGCNMPSVSQSHSFPSLIESATQSGKERELSVSSLSLGDVKEMLQENGDLFTDQHFLDDLLRSLEKIMHQELVLDSKNVIGRNNSCASPNVEPNRDLGLSVAHKQGLKKSNSRVMDTEHDVSSIQIVKEPFSFGHLPISNSSGIMLKCEVSDGIEQDVKKSAIRCDTSRSHVVTAEDLPSCISTEEKHVKFEDSTDDLPVQDKANEHEKSQFLPLYSALSHNIIRQLSGVRWQLEGWEEVAANPPPEGTSPLPILHQLLQRLKVLQLEKKHLENEVAACKAALQELHTASAVERGLHGQREARLVAVSQELGDLQKEWVLAQNTAFAQLATLKDQCQRLREEKGIMQKEVLSLKSEVARLRETVKDYDKLKISLEGTAEQIAASRRQVTEIAEENSRVNLSLQEREQRLKQLEEVRVPELVRGMEDARQEVRKMNEANNQLVQAKRVLVDELRILKLQHQALLARVVTEEQEKETVGKQKAVLESEVKQAKEEVVTLKKEIHQHYQSQMEALVAQKTAQLQEQLTHLEQQMKTNLEEQLSAQHQSHHHACTTMQQRHEKQIQELEGSHVEVMEGLKQALRKVEEENRKLKEQQQGVLSAVTSIMGQTHQDPSVLESAVTKDVGTSLKVAGDSQTAGSTTQQATTSYNGSRPGSGRAMRGIPTLGLKSSSSSDSEGSVFPDGGQTVRHHSGGQSHTTSNSSFAPSKFSQPQSVGGDRFVNFKQYCEDPQTCNSGEQCHSMPDLQSEASSSLSLWKTGTNDSGNCQKYDWRGPSGCDGPYSSKRTDKNGAPIFIERLFTASDILASDLTEDEQEPGVASSAHCQEDQHIAQAIEQIKQECGAKVKLVPGNFQGDQDPASITLQKLDRVSSLLSQGA